MSPSPTYIGQAVRWRSQVPAPKPRLPRSGNATSTDWKRPASIRKSPIPEHLLTASKGWDLQVTANRTTDAGFDQLVKLADIREGALELPSPRHPGLEGHPAPPQKGEAIVAAGREMRTFPQPVTFFEMKLLSAFLAIACIPPGAPRRTVSAELEIEQSPRDEVVLLSLGVPQAI